MINNKMSAKRDYKTEYEKFQSSTTQKKKRAKRNKDRHKAEREGRVTKGDNKDVNHNWKTGKTNVESASKNRGRREKSRKTGSSRKTS